MKPAKEPAIKTLLKRSMLFHPIPIIIALAVVKGAFLKIFSWNVAIIILFVLLIADRIIGYYLDYKFFTSQAKSSVKDLRKENIWLMQSNVMYFLPLILGAIFIIASVINYSTTGINWIPLFLGLVLWVVTIYSWSQKKKRITNIKRVKINNQQLKSIKTIFVGLIVIITFLSCLYRYHIISQTLFILLLIIVAVFYIVIKKMLLRKKLSAH